MDQEEKRKRGRPKDSSSIPNELRVNRKHAVAFEIDRQMMATVSEWEKAANHPSASMLTKTIYSMLKSAHDKSDPLRFRILLEYWVGKPKEDINLSSEDGSMKPSVIRIVSKK
jgi:hypothetical protein